MPNWNTGMADRLQGPAHPDFRPADSTRGDGDVVGRDDALKPWYGPDEMVVPLASAGAGLPDASGVKVMV